MKLWEMTNSMAFKWHQHSRQKILLFHHTSSIFFKISVIQYWGSQGTIPEPQSAIFRATLSSTEPLWRRTVWVQMHKNRHLSVCKQTNEHPWRDVTEDSGSPVPFHNYRWDCVTWIFSFIIITAFSLVLKSSDDLFTFKNSTKPI